MYVPDDDNYIVDGENYAPPKPVEDSKSKKNHNPFVKMVIIILIALSLGILVYFISDFIFNGNKKEKSLENHISTTLSVDDPVVKEVYEKVTYGRSSVSLNKYLKEQFVSLKDFSNYEKFYYAFFGLKDKNLKTDKDKKYFILDSDVSDLMREYFGDEVTYLKQGVLNISLMKPLTAGNYLTISYNNNKENYDVTVSSFSPDKQLIPVYMSTLESAVKDNDGTMTLQERVIYIVSSQANGMVSYKIYRDYNHTMLIDSKDNISLEEYQKEPISIDKYMMQANVVTYKMKENKGKYYFYQSKIEE